MALPEKKLLKLKQKYQNILAKFKVEHLWKSAVELIHSDPSKGKFRNWMLTQLKNGHDIEDILPTVKYLHKHEKDFKNINEYSNLKELEDEIKDRELKNQKDVNVKKSGKTKIWENDSWILLRINSKAAAQKYGKGSRWCITMQDASYYEQYKASNVIFYYLVPKFETNEKYAFAVKRNFDNEIIEIEIFNENDDVVNSAPDYLEYENLMKRDAESQPEAEISKIKRKKATKEEVLKFLNTFDNVENEEELEGLSGIVEGYPNTIGVASLKDPKHLKFINENFNFHPMLLSSLYEKYNDDVTFRRYVASNPNTPAEILDKLSNDDDASVIIGVARNPNISVETLDKLSNDDDVTFRRYVAQNTNTSVEILDKLSNDKDEYVRRFVAENPNTPAETLDKLSNDKDASVRRFVARNPNTPAEILDKLSNDKDASVRRFVARNPNTPAEILDKLSNNENKYVRTYVASNHNTPAEILDKLSNDKNLSVRRYVAENPNTPAEILDKLSNDEDVVVIRYVASNHNTPAEILDKLSNDENVVVRRCVAENPNTPAEILDKLSNDENADVRRYVAENPNNNPEQGQEQEQGQEIPKIEQYYSSIYEGQILPEPENIDEKESAYILAKYPNLNKDQIYGLLRFNDEIINQILIDNPSVPEDIKQNLKTEEYSEKYDSLYEDVLRMASIYEELCNDKKRLLRLASIYEYLATNLYIDNFSVEQIKQWPESE